MPRVLSRKLAHVASERVRLVEDILSFASKKPHDAFCAREDSRYFRDWQRRITDCWHKMQDDRTKRTKYLNRCRARLADLKQQYSERGRDVEDPLESRKYLSGGAQEADPAEAAENRAIIAQLL